MSTSEVIHPDFSNASRPPRELAPAYAELMATSNFSFLRSGSHPEELVAAAAALGLSGIGICDRNSFAGVVRGHVVWRDMREKMPDFRYVVGVRLVFADGTPDIIAYPSDREAYGRLCQMLTRGNKAGEKGDCRLRLADLEDFIDGQLLIFHCDEKRIEHSNNVGVLDTALRLAYTSTNPVTAGRGSLVLKAKSQVSTPAASDYTDTLTLIAAASF